MRALRFGSQAHVNKAVNSKRSHEISEMLPKSKQCVTVASRAYERYCAWCAGLDLTPTDIQTYERVLWRAPVPNSY